MTSPEEPHTSVPYASSSSSRSSSASSSSHAMSTSPPPLPPSIDLSKIPLPPLPNFAAPPPPHTVFPTFPAPCRTTSSSSSILSYSHHSHSYPPSPSLTHASTDPSSSYPSPATPFSSVEDILPRSSCSDNNLYNYPPLPYPPSAASMWAVPPLALGAPVTQAPPPPPPLSHYNSIYPTCESVEFQTATHDLDLTLTLPMSPPPTFTSTTSSLAPAPFLQTPVKVEPTDAGGWWEEQVRNQLINSVNQ